MSIWGKIAGAGVGLAIGGPLGALLGGVAGHFAVDVPQAAGRPERDKVTFAVAMIALSAKMAKADGRVTRDEIDAFEEIFLVPPEEAARVRMLYNLAKEDVAGYQHYARQIARIYANYPAVLEDVLDALFYVALADGVAHDKEIAFLENVADIFGYTDAEFRRVKASHIGPDADDPFAIIGVSSDAGLDEIKQAWRRLARENHPDALIARGVPEEFVKVAEKKLAAINAAYEKITAQRA
ncbi:MAG: TerB family tellurite resistance protein [Pseudomonadota bacterium]